MRYLDVTANQLETLCPDMAGNEQLDTLVLGFNPTFSIEKNLPVLEALSKHLNFLSIIGIPIQEEQKRRLLSVNPEMTIRTSYAMGKN